MRILRGALGVAMVVIAGCASTPAPAPTVEPKAVGLPNPASVHCLELGGTLTMQRDPSGGEYGLCALPDGSRCEEWALFRGKCGHAPAVKP